MNFSEAQVKRLRKALLELMPPTSVLERFDRIVSISTAAQFEDQLEAILEDACRPDNWTKPWENSADEELTFRAKLLDSEHQEFQSDCGGENSPAVEQAYRRGVSHGVARAIQILKIRDNSEHPLLVEKSRIDAWRRARLHFRHSQAWGGFEEPPHPCTLSFGARRSPIPPRLRWRILERDGQRCVSCGASAKTGATLEIDHIVAVSKGGGNDLENLQTLCFDCNRGKSAD